MNFYKYLEQKYYLLLEKIKLLGFARKIDEYIPSFPLFLVISLLLIGLLIYFLIPSSSFVEFVFNYEGVTLKDSFEFSVMNKGKVYNSFAVNGVSKLKLPKSDFLEIVDLSFRGYSVSKSSYPRSSKIYVDLKRSVQNIPITIFSYDGQSSMSNPVSVNLSCSNNSENRQLSFTGSTDVDMPSDCGTLRIQAVSQGYSQINQSCDSTSCILRFSNIAQNTNLYPKGSLLVSVFDSQRNPINNSTVQIFDIFDVTTPVDRLSTDEIGNRLFSNLIEGTYKVLISKPGFVTQTREVTISDNTTSNLQVTLNSPSLGEAAFTFNYRTGVKAKGEFVLRDLLGEVIHRENVQNGVLVYSIKEYGEFILDFISADNNFENISARKIMINANSKTFSYSLQENVNFNYANVKVKVVDQDGFAVRGARVFVHDEISGFELIDKSSNTDSNGLSTIRLNAGKYQFRVYDKFNESYSSSVVIAQMSSNEIPTIDVEVVLIYGFTLIEIEVTDEFSNPMPFSIVDFFNKGNVRIGTKIANSLGIVSESIKSNQEIYFSVRADPNYYQKYIPYTSESRFLMPTNPFKKKVELIQDVSNKSSEVNFLGIFENMSLNKISNVEIGKVYYLGYRVKLFDTSLDDFKFKLDVGEFNNVDLEKFFIIDSYDSSDFKEKFFDKDLKEETLGNSKVVVLDWKSVSSGVYDIYYKIQIKNSNSVKMHDKLPINYELSVNDEVVKMGTDSLVVHGNSLCANNSFCSRVTLLDVDTNIYVDPYSQNSYLVSPTREYFIEYDLINGILGADGVIQNGTLQIFNTLNDGESIDVVKSNPVQRNAINMKSIEVSGPKLTDRNSSMDNSNTIFKEKYDFSSFSVNEFINVKSKLSILGTNTYLSNVLVDNFRKRVVLGKSALSILFKLQTSKNFSVDIEPKTNLIPNVSQRVKVFVKDNSVGVLDASVTIKIKRYNSPNYEIYSNCSNLLTNNLGEVSCEILSLDAELNNKFQIIVEKDGYNPYFKNNFEPDFVVSSNHFEYSPERLSVNLIHPYNLEDFANLRIKNNSSKDLLIEDIDIVVDRASTQYSNYFNLSAMKSYINSKNRGNVLFGVDDSFYDNTQVINNFFKSIGYSENSLESNVKIAGILKVKFATDSLVNFDLDIPFNSSIVSNGYPTNYENCLYFSFDNPSISGVSNRAFNIPFEYKNNCVIETSSGRYEVEIDSLHLNLDIVNGPLSLGRVSSLSIPSIQYNSDNITFGIAKNIANNVKTSMIADPNIGTFNYIPSSNSGSAKYRAKLVGFVNTSQGVKMIESKESVIDVHIVNINNCVSVLKDGKKISYLDFEGETLEVEVQNECSSPVSVKLCYNNENVRSLGCGSDLGEFRGVTFEGENKFNLLANSNKFLKINRPSTPGAYNIDFWVKHSSFFTYLKILDLKLNVKTSNVSNLYSNNPFLNTESSDGKYHSDVLQLYNRSIGVDSGVSIMNNYAKLIGLQDNKFADFNFKKHNELKNFPKHVDGLLYSGATLGVAGAATAIGVGAAYGIAVSTLTSVGASSGALSTGLVTILGAGLATAAVPVIGAAVGVVVIGVTLLIAAFFVMDYDHSDILEYIVPMYDTSRVLDLNANNPNHYINDAQDIMNYSGDSRFIFKSHQKRVWGRTDLRGSKIDKEIRYSVSCPNDYVVYEEGIVLLGKSENLGNGKSTIYNSCSYQSPNYKIENNSVIFYPQCGGNPGGDFRLSSFALVSCKLKDELWNRSQNDGVNFGEVNTGLLRVKVKDIDFSNCDLEWCYIDYKFNVGNDSLDIIQDYYRIAVKNPNKSEPIINFTGESCLDYSGSVRGFTGESAVPRVKYQWDGINTTFCDPKDGYYCDSTQFMFSNLLRIISSDTNLSLSNLKDNLVCPKEVVNNDLDSGIRVISGGDSLAINSRPRISYDNNDPNKSLSLVVPLKTMTITGSNPQISVVATSNGSTLTSSCIFSEQGTNPITNERDVIPICTINLGVQIPDEINETTQIFKNSVNLVVDIGNEKKTIGLDLDIKINYPQNCMLDTPSTKVVNGRMLYNTFFDNLDNHKQEKLLSIQDELYYQVTLMDDGFNESFLRDFYSSCQNNFLSCQGIDSLALGKMIDEDRFKIVNTSLNNGYRTNGPGIYNVYNSITYNSVNDLDINNATIVVNIEKVSSPQVDSAFYYMPINGRVGVVNDSVLREGYGVGFRGDIIKLNNNLNNQISSVINTQNNPYVMLNFKNQFNFEYINSTNRGVIFEAKKQGNTWDILFTPNIEKHNFTYNMKNENIGVDTSLNYSVSYQNTLPSSLARLPFDVLDKNKKDFTDQLLYDTYPKFSFISNIPNSAKIEYSKESVTNLSDYNIYTNIFAQKGITTSIKVTSRSNLSSDEFKSSKNSLDIDSLESMFEKIRDENLCIGGSVDNMYVFVNEI